MLAALQIPLMHFFLCFSLLQSESFLQVTIGVEGTVQCPSTHFWPGQSPSLVHALPGGALVELVVIGPFAHGYSALSLVLAAKFCCGQQNSNSG